MILTASRRNFNWLMLKINCKITQQQPQQPTRLQFSCNPPLLCWLVTGFLWSKLMPFKNSATPSLFSLYPSLHLVSLATAPALQPSHNSNLLLLLSVEARPRQPCTINKTGLLKKFNPFNPSFFVSCLFSFFTGIKSKIKIKKTLYLQLPLSDLNDKIGSWSERYQ